MKSKKVKQEEADKRQGVYDSLSPKQKIKKLNSKKLRAAKERKKLGFPKIPKNCVN